MGYSYEDIYGGADPWAGWSPTPEPESNWLGDIWGGVKGAAGDIYSAVSPLLTNKNFWNLLGLGGQIGGAALGGDTTTTTQQQQQQTQQQRQATQQIPSLLPYATAGYESLMGLGLPLTQAAMTSPLTPETQSLYQYLFGGGGNLLGNILGTGQEARGYLGRGQEALDIGKIGPQWADIIAGEQLRKFTPFQQAGAGPVQRSIIEEITRQAMIPLALKQADYGQQAAGLIPQLGLTDIGLMASLMGLGQYPMAQQRTALGDYMQVMTGLTGAPYGTTGLTDITTSLGGTLGQTVEGPEQDLWSRILTALGKGAGTLGTPATSPKAVLY